MNSNAGFFYRVIGLISIRLPLKRCILKNLIFIWFYYPDSCLTSGLRSGAVPSSSCLDRDPGLGDLWPRPEQPWGLPPGLHSPPGSCCNDLDPRHIRDSGLPMVPRHQDKGAGRPCWVGQSRAPAGNAENWKVSSIRYQCDIFMEKTLDTACNIRSLIKMQRFS